MRQVWLSHVLEPSTPLYAGAEISLLQKDRSIARGDSCNTSVLNLPSHAGTHVDAPRHFFRDGTTVDSPPPSWWRFASPTIARLVHGSCDECRGQLIGSEDLYLPDNPKCDLLLIRTGFEVYRNHRTYWENAPGLKVELADRLASAYPNLRAIGMDIISISSLQHRETGRQAHRAFLSKDLWLIEDMRLTDLTPDSDLLEVLCLPLRFQNADGSPCTIIGTLTS